MPSSHGPANTKRTLVLALAGLALWTLLVGYLARNNSETARQLTWQVAQSEARSTFMKDVSYRLWASSVGGVYVLDSRVAPNPYLSHVPNRDIEGPGGQGLTLVNPAYMTRLVQELSRENFSLDTRIVSTKPINPANQADAWESAALGAFDKAGQETFELIDKEGKPTYRYIAPFIVDENCLKCHGDQGYKVGDVRGGISVSIPENRADLQLFEQKAYQDNMFLGLMWLAGAVALVALARSNMRHARLRDQFQNSLAMKNAAVESATSGIAIADMTGDLTYVNPAFLRLWGYDSPAEALGKPAVSFWDNPDEAQAVQDAIRSQGSWTGTLTATRKDGQRRVFQLVSNVILDKDGKPLALMASFLDISQKHADDELIQAALAEKDTLFQELSHRIKNNMQVMVALIHLQGIQAGKDGQAGAFRDLENRIHSMALVHTMLYQNNNLHAINLARYLGELVPTITGSYGFSPDQVHIDLDLDADILTGLDRAVPCGLVCTELVMNACKHSFRRRGGGTLSAGLYKEASGGFRITIANDGDGPGPDFDLKAHANMGLTTLMSIVEGQLRGTLAFDSSQGLRVDIIIPPPAPQPPQV